MTPEKIVGYARLGLDERFGIQGLLNAGASVRERSISTAAHQR